MIKKHKIRSVDRKSSPRPWMEHPLRMMPVLVIVLLLSSCREEFWPDLGSKYDKILVVEGMITNLEGPYTVMLSYSSSFEDPDPIPAGGFEVTLLDDQGLGEALEETEPGTYMSRPDGIRGTPGRLYKMNIQSPDGRTYESDFEKLHTPAGIDSIYALLEYRNIDYFPFDLPGYQFYVDTRPAESDSVHFVWQLTQTYQYSVDFGLFYYYDGRLHTVLNPDSIKTCWRTDPVYSIFTTSLKGLTEPVISSFPLHFVGFDTREFSEGYSLFVRQLTVSESAGEFWNAVNELHTSSDGLYTRLPYQIRGNIHNIDNRDEPVLGYFMTAGVSQQRLFYEPPPPSLMYYFICELQPEDYEDYGWMFIVNDPQEWPKLVTRDPNNRRAVPNPFCIDCRLSGGTTVKPEFWIN